MHTSTSRRIAISVLTGLACLLMGFLEAYGYEAPRMGGWAVILLGVAIAAVGTVVGSKPPPRLEPIQGEIIVYQGHPSMKPAFALIVAGIVFFVVRIFLVAAPGGIWAEIRYLPLWIGVFMCSWGIWRYWMTHCTTYCATNLRVVSMHQILRVDELDLPKNSINSVGLEVGIAQRITNRGNLQLLTGGGNEDQRAVFRDIDSPRAVRNAIAEQYGMSEGAGI